MSPATEDARGGRNCTHQGTVTVHLKRVAGKFEREKAVCNVCHEKWPTEIDFSQSAAQTYFHSSGLGSLGVRTVQYFGECLCCETRTYSHDDGEDDPRGILGDHALGMRISPDDHGFGGLGFKSFALCFGCADSQDTIDRGIRTAKARWNSAKLSVKMTK